jgi:S-adenosylmethionine-diacylglycerol 3-amino-3-carboxypropyl transferase
MYDFSDGLHYSTCNEDSLVEIKALELRETDKVVCITGSGGRVLNLLTQNPNKIISIDLNPIQNWLLELKMVAIKNFNYDDYAKFLGLTPCKERLELFNKIKQDLSKEGRSFWEKENRLIKKGVLYQGKFEKYCKYFSDTLKESMKEKVDKILTFDCLVEQKKYYEDVWKKDSNWSEIAKHHRVDLKESVPNYTLYYGEKYDFDYFIYHVLDKGFKKTLVKDNHYLCMILDGSYERARKLPLCLEEEYYFTLKNNLNKVEIVTDNIITYLGNLKPNTLDKFSISDLAGYLNNEEHSELFKNIIYTARKKAILCARHIKGQRGIPEKYVQKIERKIDLEREIKEIDLTLEYEIVIGVF